MITALRERAEALPRREKKGGADMRARLGAACVLAVAVTSGATVATAKPVVWLRDPLTGQRLPAGTTERALFEVDRGCVSQQEARISTNGRAADKVTVAPAASYFNCGTEKMAGAIAGLMFKVAGQSPAMTTKLTVHEFVEPWCVYSLPKSWTTLAEGQTFGFTTLGTPLDKRASFGVCAPTHATEVAVEIENFEGRALLTEVTG